MRQNELGSTPRWCATVAKVDRARALRPRVIHICATIATVWFGLCLVATPARSNPVPAVTATVDSATVTLGDPVRYGLTVRHRTDQLPKVPSSLSLTADASVAQLAPLGPRAVNGGLETVISWEVRFFELGEHEISPSTVVLTSAAGDTTSVQSRPVTVIVASVREETDQELRDIKPPVTIPGGVPLWLVAVAAAVALAGLIALLRWLLGRRKGTEVEAARARIPTDYVVEFKKIARMGLLERRAFLIYYTLLSQTLRRFLEEKVGVEAMERTSEEVADALEDVRVDPVQALRINEFLAQADLVKFACAVPAVEQARQAPGTGQEIVRAVEAALGAAAPPDTGGTESMAAAAGTPEPASVEERR